MKEKERFVLIHPLYDEPEEKISIENASPMELTFSAKMSLIALQLYIFTIISFAIVKIVNLIV